MYLSEWMCHTHYHIVQQALLPFSIIGSDEEITVNGRSVRGRQYPWGAVEGK